jgi:uncharacterized membrane protein
MDYEPSTTERMMIKMKKWLLPLASTLAAVLISVFTYNSLPAEMAVHFDSADNPDNWVSRPIGAFLSPVLILFISWTVIFSIRFEKDENKRARTEAALPTVAGAVSLLLLAVHGSIIAFNLGYDIRASTIASFIVGGVFIVLGNLLPRLPQGSFQWPKLSDHKHRQIARFQGKLMVFSGLIFILLAFLPSAYSLPAFIAVLACFIAVTIVKFIAAVRN